MDDVAGDLYLLARVFKVTLQEPDLLDLTAKCVMNVIEYVVNECLDDELDDCRYDVERLLDLFCKATGDRTADQTPVGMEIIMRYKSRICKMRSPINEDILADAPTIYEIIYNNKY